MKQLNYNRNTYVEIIVMYVSQTIGGELICENVYLRKLKNLSILIL